MTIKRQKYIRAILMLALIVVLCMCASIVFGSKIYPSYINSSFTLSLWLEDFTYQDDPDEYWKKPWETVRDKGGDCEDSASLVRYILEDINYSEETSLIVVKKDKTGHAFNVLEDEEGYTMFSNFVYYSYNFDTLYELLEFWYPDWDTLYYIDHDNNIQYIGKNTL